MKKTELIMGMPITVEIISEENPEIFDRVFAYFKHVDGVFSTYKDSSEISKINRGEIGEGKYSEDVKEVFRLCEETKKDTEGYFDVRTPQGTIDPSGLVKGWAIWKASNIIKEAGFNNFYIEAGGDIQPSGKNSEGNLWRVGLKNPFNPQEIIKVINVSNQGVATSGTYERGQHIYNPKGDTIINEIASVTVVGPNVYEADRFATAAFAMGSKGIEFIEKYPNLQGYMVGKDGVALMTSGLEKYL